MQPAQQHGRFLPSRSSSTVRLIRLARVFSCLASSTQHINSLRAIGVKCSQRLVISFVSVNSLTKSAGNSCTRPPEIFFFIYSTCELYPACLSSTGGRVRSRAATSIPAFLAHPGASSLKAYEWCFRGALIFSACLAIIDLCCVVYSLNRVSVISGQNHLNLVM